MKRGLQLHFSGGDRVREKDGRHEGTVIAQWDWTVRVAWDSQREGISPWKEDLAPDQLERLPRRLSR